jgi:cytochrome c oxidase subunit 2
MGGWIEVMSQTDFDNWLRGNANLMSPAAAGKELFTTTLGCPTCHNADGTGGRGPALTGLFGKQVQLEGGATVTADEAYLRESIINPQAQLVLGFQPIMPTFKGQLTEEQILQLIAYIKSLSPPVDAGSTTTPASPSPSPAAAAKPNATASPASSTNTKASNNRNAAP